MESSSKQQSPEEDLWSWGFWCNLFQWLEGTWITPKARAKNRRGWTTTEVRLQLLQTLLETQWDHASEITFTLPEATEKDISVLQGWVIAKRQDLCLNNHRHSHHCDHHVNSVFSPVTIILTLRQTKVPTGLSAQAMRASYQPFSLKGKFTPAKAGLEPAAFTGEHLATFFPAHGASGVGGSGRHQQGFLMASTQQAAPAVRQEGPR